MSTTFQAKKQAIVKSLKVPAGEYSDRSPKGSVDESIHGLIDSINSLDELVTTSSCSGRFVVYLDGPASIEQQHQLNGTDATSQSGKGGGTWLFTSHKPLNETFAWQSLRRADSTHLVLDSQEPLDVGARLLHCKFEPMLLHIIAATLSSAKLVLSAAQTAGFRESGISSISQSPDGAIQKVLVAVRTTGLNFDGLIGFCDQQGIIHPAVDDGYLQALAMQASRNFVTNSERTERFGSALKASFHKAQPTWESAEQRARRKRDEGIRSREARARDLSSRPDADPYMTALDLDNI